MQARSQKKVSTEARSMNEGMSMKKLQPRKYLRIFFQCGKGFYNETIKQRKWQM